MSKVRPVLLNAVYNAREKYFCIAKFGDSYMD